jgi:hypothetical protein
MSTAPTTLSMPAATIPAVEPLAVRGDEAARLCGVSPRLWRALDSSGRVPRGRRLGRAKIWSVDELRAWLRAGCPARDRWESMQERGAG